MKKQEKLAAILEAAFIEFTGKRFDAVKLDEIAARAGVGKGTLYLYFKNKEELFIQMALEGVDEMATRVGEISAMDSPFRDRFFQFGTEIGVFVEKRAVMFRLMHQIGSDELQKKFMSQHRVLINAARSLLQAGVDEGIFRADVTVADLHCLLIGPLLFRGQLNRFNNDTIAMEPLLKLFWDAATLKPEI
jgi:TetR/AcrR family transcriptional regulator